MSTRSVTHILDEQGEPLTSIYVRSDGYPTGYGAELGRFLSGRKVVNGYGSHTPAKASNGMGCLAASLIAEQKDGIGQVYVHRADPTEEQEYVYTVSLSSTGFVGFHEERTLMLRVEGHGATIYDGPADAFDPVEAEATERRLDA